MNWIQGDLVKKQQVKQPHPNHTDVDVWPSMFVTPQRVELSGNYEDIVPKRCVCSGGRVWLISSQRQSSHIFSPSIKERECALEIDSNGTKPKEQDYCQQ